MKVLYMFIFMILGAGNLPGHLTEDEVEIDEARIEAGAKHFHRITGEVAREAYKENHLYFFGHGGGHIGGINYWKVSFLSQTKKPLSMERLRVLLVKWTERLIYKINTDSEIRPFLKYVPFDEKHTRISITCCNKRGQYFSHNDFSIVAAHTGHLIYSQDRGDDEPSEDVYRETYEEALRIVREQAPQVLPVRDWEVVVIHSENKEMQP